MDSQASLDAQLELAQEFIDNMEQTLTSDNRDKVQTSFGSIVKSLEALAGGGSSAVVSGPVGIDRKNVV